MGFEDIEELLRATSRAVAVPPTPSIAVALRVRIAGPPAAEEHRWRRLIAPRRGSRWQPALVALVVLAVLFAGALAVPPVRDAVARLFHVSGLDLQRSPHGIPTAATPAAPGGLGLGAEVSLAEARRRASSRVLVPATLGDPDQVYVLGSPSGVAVTLVYLPRPGLPAAGTTGVGALVTELPGYVNAAFLMKFVDPQTTVQEVRVGADPGYWIAGYPHQVLVNLGQDTHPEQLRLAGDTLVWSNGSVVNRIESALDRDSVVRIATSMR